MGKYFGTDGFRGEANVNLTVDHAFKVGRFLGWYYGKNHEDGKAKVVIGKDTRRSSYMPAVQVGSEVEIFGKRQRVDDLARLAGTIPYELTCAVSKRVPRIFLRGGQVVGTELRMYLK